MTAFHWPELANALIFAAIVVALALGYVAWLFHTAPLINHGGTMTEPPPDEATPLHDLVARLFDQAEYEAAVHGHEVVAEAIRYCEEAAL